MQTLGNLLKDSRRKKGYTLSDLEEKTRIKTQFLKALEEQRWDALPEYPVVVGFVKNVAGSLDTSESLAVALLRRDYPPKKLSINPKPDITNKFVWGPAVTFFVGLGVVVLIVLSYLTKQYFQFLSPPNLEIISPKENQVVKENEVRIVGKTNPNASVTVNNQPISLEETGDFVANLEIFEGTNEIVVTATSRSGKETVVRRKIIPELK